MLEKLKQNKGFLVCLFLFSLLIRVLFFSLYLNDDKNYLNYDSVVYHQVALQIIQGNGISNQDGSAHFYRLPGYSFFLAACYIVFGVDVKKALWLQILFAALIPVFIFLLSLVLFPENLLLAKIVSILSAFHLGYVLFSGFVMTESFFVFFFSVFLILFFSQLYFWSGIFLGIASLFRPVGHYLIVVSLILLIISKFDFWRKITNGLILFAGWFLIVFGWLLRNWLLTGYIFFHTLSGIHFLKHSAARLCSNLNNCSYVLALDNLAKEVDELQRKREIELGHKLNDIEHCNLAEKVSFAYLKRDLFLTLRHFASNMFKTCFSLYSAELLVIDSRGELPEYENKRGCKDVFLRFLFPQTSKLFLKMIIYLEIIFLFFLWVGFIGFILNYVFFKNKFFLLFQVLPFVALFVFVSLACGFARLRLPVESFLIILSFRFWLDFLCVNQAGE